MTLRTAELIKVTHGIDNGQDLFVVDLRFVMNKPEFKHFLELLDLGTVQIKGVFSK